MFSSHNESIGQFEFRRYHVIAQLLCLNVILAAGLLHGGEVLLANLQLRGGTGDQSQQTGEAFLVPFDG